MSTLAPLYVGEKKPITISLLFTIDSHTTQEVMTIDCDKIEAALLLNGNPVKQIFSTENVGDYGIELQESAIVITPPVEMTIGFRCGFIGSARVKITMTDGEIIEGDTGPIFEVVKSAFL